MEFKAELTGNFSFDEEERETLIQAANFFRTVPDMITKDLERNGMKDPDYTIFRGENWYDSYYVLRYSNLMSDIATADTVEFNIDKPVQIYDDTVYLNDTMDMFHRRLKEDQDWELL